jgi:hypothetical protein
MCRTFGARFLLSLNPDLTVGPIHCRPYGPYHVFESLEEAAMNRPDRQVGIRNVEPDRISNHIGETGVNGLTLVVET